NLLHRCGLYYKLHGSARPISMKSDIICKLYLGPLLDRLTPLSSLTVRCLSSLIPGPLVGSSDPTLVSLSRCLPPLLSPRAYDTVGLHSCLLKHVTLSASTPAPRAHC
ncbi:hypothetical protein EV702DRAFT_982921, partial [Suillus placidus]